METEPADTTTGAAKDRYAVYNPRTGESIYEVAEPSREDVERVFDVARTVSDDLRAMSVSDRLAEVDKLRRTLLANRGHVVNRIVEETGKSRMDALMLDVFPALDAMVYYQNNAKRFLADRVVRNPVMLMGKKSRVYYEPLGPVLIISPWNYPFNLSIIPFICAFTAGNPVILKPSEHAPLKGVFEDLLHESGFMDGALQIVYASRNTAHMLIDQKPAKIHFTGSTKTGRKVMAAAAEHLIPVELELGGKDPFIVFDDANLERTVNGALWGGMCNCGQTCTAAERIYVHETIYEKFIDMLKTKAEAVVTLAQAEASDDELALTIGCMTAEFQIREIEDQIEDAKAKGARILTGGVREPGSHIYPPTIVIDVNHSMRIQKDETFGPVLTVMPFATEDEVVELANDSPFGLSASVWSADLARADRVARRLVTGSVSVNNIMATHGNQGLPYGGVKESGFGRYRGPEGLHAFSNTKAVLIDKQSSRVEPYWFPYTPGKYNLLNRIIEALFSRKPLALLKTLPSALKLESLAKRERL